MEIPNDRKALENGANKMKEREIDGEEIGPKRGSVSAYGHEGSGGRRPEGGIKGSGCTQEKQEEYQTKLQGRGKPNQHVCGAVCSKLSNEPTLNSSLSLTHF